VLENALAPLHELLSQAEDGDIVLGVRPRWLFRFVVECLERGGSRSPAELREWLRVLGEVVEDADAAEDELHEMARKGREERAKLSARRGE
jgi:hypothetical protein